jgi:hypothetical protein
MAEKMTMTSPIGKLMAAFVLVIIAVVILTEVVTVGTGITQVQNSSGTLNFNQARTAGGATNPAIEFYVQAINDSKLSWRATNGACNVAAVAASINLTNTTNALFTKNTDWKVSTANGSITFLNTLNMNSSGYDNNSIVSWRYCADGYIDGWTATITNLIYGFIALAALGVAISLFYSIAKDYGIA